jgi:hypothetical protein
MFIIDTPVPRVPGLRGSDSARAENLDYAGPYKPLGGQPLYGSGSTSGSNMIGNVRACGGPITTGNVGGSGDGSIGNDMTPPALTPCPGSGPTRRPPRCPKCPPRPGRMPGGAGNGPGGCKMGDC